jgi:uncharacterized membrane-anchored protein YitT (DUF2179 family)
MLDCESIYRACQARNDCIFKFLLQFSFFNIFFFFFDFLRIKKSKTLSTLIQNTLQTTGAPFCSVEDQNAGIVGEMVTALDLRTKMPEHFGEHQHPAINRREWSQI